MRRARALIVKDNREAVIGVARRHFETHGYHGAGIDAIAEEAGFSKGVIYSQFGSKDELFLAVLEDNIERRHGEMESGMRRAALPDLTALARMSIGENLQTVAWQAALLEFRAHAWRHPEVNRRYQALHARTITGIAALIESVFRGNGAKPPMPAAAMAVVALAASTGVVAEFMADPAIDVSAVTATLGTALTAMHPPGTTA